MRYPFLLLVSQLAFLPLTLAEESFPVVPDDVDVALFARDPLVRNPCAITFDAKGRLCVGMGPQYRKPTPETPGDSVWIFIDEDQDGEAEDRLKFATGLNAIQGMAWRGEELWIANAPDLTVVRDDDGDDVADTYVRLYTDLGNLEHGLHGLNWGPDGMLYMSKGNSKGLNQPPARVAPKPFRDLWGMESPEGTPDFPSPVTFRADAYQKHYHDPSDDWGLCGGILRCHPDGTGLEIVTRGARNPWDMAFDDGFDWLGTDNDQNHGDKFFSPFYGAHFGWGHPWSYEWEGLQHFPSAPASGPLFEGSGTGVIFVGLPHYPEAYRNVFLVNDWLKREIYIYRPRWDGAWMKPETDSLPLFAHADGGRSMSSSSGRAFDPVDIELGPDGALYISSWGREYGANVSDGEMQNEGRLYRLWPKAAPPQPWTTTRDPWKDLGHHLPVWRTNAQEAILAMGKGAIDRLQTMALAETSSKALETWSLWTLGRIAPEDPDIDAFMADRLQPANALNPRLQALRILAHRARLRGESTLPQAVVESLQSSEPRVRLEAVLALRQAGDVSASMALIDLVADEEDRIVFYATWGAMGDVMGVNERKALLEDTRERVRLAALLSLLEEDALTDVEIDAMARDAVPVIASLASKRLGGKAEAIIKGPALDAAMRAPASDAAPLKVVGKIESRTGKPYQEARLQLGALAYTDRDYRFRKIPAELAGETFIQVANSDDEATDGGFTLRLLYPATIFLADDTRGEELPSWARGQYMPTEMTLHNGDHAMRIFQMDVPAGEVRFGSNRDDVGGNKAHYLVIVRPKLLDPPSQAATLETVLASLAQADADRGRTLFHSSQGATCVTCHRMEGLGNVFAPDLSDIASRADATFIIRSILDPSAEITEGFAMQVVTQQDGSTVGGIVLEETGRSLTFGVVGGQTVPVAKTAIAKRETVPISAMPILAPMLQAQQIADITAYLLQGQDKKEAEKEEGLSFIRHPGRLDIQADGSPLLSYYFEHEKTKRPFFAHLHTPSGHPVTRNFPPIEGQDPTDHAFMHPGLSLGFAVLDDENFWHNDRGQVIHERFLEEPQVDGSLTFQTRHRYQREDGSLLCHEVARYEIVPNEDGYLILLESAFVSGHEFAFGVKEEMGLAMRVASPLRVKGGQGGIYSGKGGRDEAGTWGVVDQWWDYAGLMGDKHVGLQIMSGPGNPEVWAHSRDYGVLVANPFPVDRKPNRDKKTVVPANQPFTLRFGVQVHEHSAREDYDPQAAYERYRAQAHE